MALPASIVRPAALLAINLLLGMIWGFAGISKLHEGMPSWFGDRFGKTILATFPGLPASFWLLAMSELAAFGLAMAALVRIEFLRQRPPTCLAATSAWSLFVFLQLGFGQWLTGDFAGGFQQFMYFCGTLLTLQFIQSAGRVPISS